MFIGVGGNGEAAEVIYPRPCRKRVMAQALKIGTCKKLLRPKLRTTVLLVCFCFCLVGGERVCRGPVQIQVQSSLRSVDNSRNTSTSVLELLCVYPEVSTERKHGILIVGCLFGMK